MRPEIYADLSEDVKRGREVMRIEMAVLPPDGPVLTALGTFLNIAEQRKLKIYRTPYSTVTIHLQPTDVELEQALSDAKDSWDRCKGLYEAAEVSKTEPEDYTRHQIRTWAQKENLPLPWEA
jgi:hypothetical protein